MANRYKASILSSTAATSTTSAASGVWKLSDIAQAVTAGLWPVVAAIGDALFNYVSLLLPFTNTNGKTNNTFLDSSTNNFTITRNGTPTQGTFTPFSQTGWGGGFNGSTDYLSVPDNAALEFGTNSITLECWFYMTGTSGYLFDKNNSGTGSAPGFSLFVSTTAITWYYDAVSNGYVISPITTTVAQNQWNHIALVRSVSGTTTNAVFLNGARVGTSTTATAFPNNTQNFRIGAAFLSSSIYSPITGFVSNARIVNGTAVYDPSLTTLTVPTAPLTAITNTSLLTLQSSYFKDNSANAFTITPSGTPSIQAFSPFLPTAAYQSETSGGTAYFDGNADYLNTISTAAAALGTTYTIECFIYRIGTASVGAYTTVMQLINTQPYGTSLTGFMLTFDGGNVFNFRDSSGSVILSTSDTNLPLNTWIHVAIVRNGSGASNLTMYLNGASIVTGTSSGTQATNQTMYIGGDSNGNCSFPGYISNLRIVKGTAVYTANFTPPTAPLAPIANTSLLLSGTNAGAIDNAAKNVAITNSSAQISTATSKWGGSSLLCSLAADKLTIPDSPLLRFGTGDFTVEGWFYLNFDSALRNIVSKGNTANTLGWTVGISSVNRIFASYSATSLTGTVTTLAANTWYYFAMVRSGTATGNIKLYINGTLEASSATAITTDFNQTDPLYIGSGRTGTTPAFDGYIDDIRITKAARTVTTTPTAAFSLQ